MYALSMCLCACLFSLFFIKAVMSMRVYVCEGLPAGLTLAVSPLPIHIIGGEQRRVCVQAFSVYVYIMQNSLASHPGLGKKKSQPGGHFEIPGAHLANPGNWGVYISATEKGKRPDAPLSCVHIDITHIAVSDRRVCICE